MEIGQTHDFKKRWRGQKSYNYQRTAKRSTCPENGVNEEVVESTAQIFPKKAKKRSAYFRANFTLKTKRYLSGASHPLIAPTFDWCEAKVSSDRIRIIDTDPHQKIFEPKKQR